MSLVDRPGMKRALSWPVEGPNKRPRYNDTPFSLPIELFQSIVHHLSLYDASSNLTLVSQAFYHATQDILSNSLLLDDIIISANEINPNLPPSRYLQEMKLTNNIFNNRRKNLVDYKVSARGAADIDFSAFGSALVLSNTNTKLENQPWVYWMPPNPNHLVYQKPTEQIPPHLYEDHIPAIFETAGRLYTSVTFPQITPCGHRYYFIVSKDEDSFLEIDPEDNRLTLYSFDPITTTQKVFSIPCPKGLWEEFPWIPYESMHIQVISSGFIIMNKEDRRFLYFKTRQEGLSIKDATWHQMPPLDSEHPQYDIYIFRDNAIYFVNQVCLYSCKYDGDAFSIETALFDSETILEPFQSIGPYIAFLSKMENTLSLLLYHTEEKTRNYFHLHTLSSEEDGQYLRYELSSTPTYLVAAIKYELYDVGSYHKSFILTLLPQLRLIPLPLDTQYNRGYLYYTQMVDGCLHAKVDSFLGLEENLEDNRERKDRK